MANDPTVHLEPATTPSSAVGQAPLKPAGSRTSLKQEKPKPTRTSGTLKATTAAGSGTREKDLKILGEADSQLAERTNLQRRFGHFQYGTLCITLFIIGWNDGSIGPLIPRMREEYNIGYTIVSLIFILSCVGFIIGGILNVWLTAKLGFGKVLVLGCTLQIIVYSVQAAAPPFPVFAIFNLFNGMGICLQDSLAHGFVGSLTRHRGTKLQVIQSFYGLGGLLAPFVSTQFANMERWSFHYLTCLGLALLNLVCQIVAFRFKNMDDALRDGGEEVESSAHGGASNQGRFREIMGNKNVHLLGFFLFAHVGVVITFGGWIVSYIIEVRHGGPSSGYIASGYYGGILLSRIVLLPFNKWVGERRVQFLYIALTLAFEFIIWFVPSLAVNAAMVALVGLVMGPIYPLTINLASRALPRHIYVGGLGWIAGFGQAGSAAIPFITGAIAQNHGIKNLHPTVIAMIAVMAVLLWMTPDKPLVAAEAPDATYTEEKPSVLDEERSIPLDGK